MPTSVVQICNQALQVCGTTQRIESLSDNTNTARACSLWYETVRDDLLRAHDWPFAMAYATLAEIQTEPNFSWGYSYGLPTDCIRAIELCYDGVRSPYSLPRIPFQIVYSAGVSILVSDQAEARLRYTARVDNPVQFPPDFGLALAYSLALAIAPGMNVNEASQQRIAAKLARLTPQAKLGANRERQSDPRPTNDVLAAYGNNVPIIPPVA